MVNNNSLGMRAVYVRNEARFNTARQLMIKRENAGLMAID